MRQFVTLHLLCAAAAVYGGDAGAPAEIPAALTTAGGSRLIGMIESARPIVLRGAKGLQKLAFGQIKSVSFGERFDPNLENDARVAVGDLRSDQYDVREKALAKLRSLGRAAAPGLKAAASSPDAEVATRARNLLGEMGLVNAAGPAGDSVSLADGSTAQGTILTSEFAFRCRWGRLRFPLPALRSIEALLPEEVAAATLVNQDQPPVNVQPKAEQPEDAGIEELGNPFLEAARMPDVRRLPGLTVLTMEQRPNPNPKEAPQKRLVDVKPGDNLEEAYAAWGALLRPTEPGAAAVASEHVVWMKDKSVEVKNADCEVSFVLPGSYNQKLGAGRPGGVHLVGAIVEDDPAAGASMAVYDNAGRQIALASSRQTNDGQAMIREASGAFKGVRSKVPIARVRFFRAGGKGDLHVTGIVFDRVVSIERPAGRAAVWLVSGERLAGQLADAELGKGLALRPEFCDEKAPPVQIALDQIERFEPAPDSAAPAKTEKAGKVRSPSLSTPHGVLLQSGESFRARLLKLDDANVLFMLPGGSELKLPRRTLRKIDLAPAEAEPGELPAAIAVGAEEKPGVDFRRPERLKEEVGPPEPKEKAEEKPKKKKNVLDSQQEMKALENAEILEADTLTGELKIKDDAGEWTIGLAPVKTLVFPKDPDAAPAEPKVREWVVTLRGGSRFDVALKALTPEALSADMAGGTVTLQWQAIESVERKAKK